MRVSLRSHLVDPIHAVSCFVCATSRRRATPKLTETIAQSERPVRSWFIDYSIGIPPVTGTRAPDM